MKLTTTDRLKSYQTKNKLSRRALARQIGISAPMLMKIETGKNRVTDKTAKKIARALGLKAWHLLCE